MSKESKRDEETAAKHSRLKLELLVFNEQGDLLSF